MEDLDHLLSNEPDLVRRAVSIALAKKSLMDFTLCTKPDYRAQWFHRHLAHLCDLFALNKIQRLMVLMPPQHGKSELTSRRLPAYLLGHDPSLRIMGLSYNDIHAKKFNRQVQRIIDSETYHKIFPDTRLNMSNVVTSSHGQFLRNSKEFEIAGCEGSYMSAGVGSGITGNPVDIILVDDPIKSRKEADSKQFRDNTWDWWLDDVGSRIRERTQIMITVTPWHHDDLIGRIMADETEARKWTVISYPAIREDDDNPDDPREIGRALWPEEKSEKSLLDIKRQTPRTYNSLYQCKPIDPKGNMFKKDWFNIIPPSAFVSKMQYASKVSPRLFVIDTAQTADGKNDPNGVMCFLIMDEELYIVNYTGRRLELPDLLKFLPKYFVNNRYQDRKSKVWVEPKDIGKSVVSSLKRVRLNGRLITIKEDFFPDTDKQVRAAGILDICETGRVNLVAGPWVESFLQSVCGFPVRKHDEEVDCLIMACDKLENGWGSTTMTSSTTRR